MKDWHRQRLRFLLLTSPDRNRTQEKVPGTWSDAWNQLLDLIDRASTSGATEFAPGVELGWELWWQIVTLPPSIAKLTSIRKLMLYGSNLDRIPPEIGEMESLEEFDPYTSYRLHWLPYEITRCSN